ncbi:MAG: S9 family peptidase [Candidatus Bruticola sp.]
MNFQSRVLFNMGAIVMGLACLALPAAAGNGTPEKVSDQSAAVRQVRGNLTIEGVPEIPDSLIERLAQYSNVRSAVVGDWDPQAKGLLVFTRFGQTSQVHRVARPGAFREQITFFDEPVNSIAVNPDSKRNEMVMLKDVGGNENYQIFLWNFSDGRSKMLTNGKARYGSVIWNDDGTKIAYQSTERDGANWDIWIMDPKHPEQAKMVYSPGGYWCVMDWSRQGDRLLLYKYVSITESSMVVLDLNSGKTMPVGIDDASQPPFALGEVAKFSPDGKGVFFTTDSGSEFQRLAYQDFSTKKISYMAREINADVVDLQISKDGSLLAFVTNEDGFNRVYVMDLNKGNCKYRRLSAIPDGVVYGLKFAPDHRLAVSIGSGNMPCDTYSINLDKQDECLRWTFSEAGGLDTSSFAKPELFHYPTFDKDGENKRQIPAFVYMPKKATAEPCPVLIQIHGGPESQYQPYFSSFIQYLVNEKGIAVIAPNVRGSHGYGKTYVSLDNGYKREDSVKDIGALIEWIKKQPQFNGKIAVMGGSYGGYMTLASMTHYSQELSCGIDNVGISNFVTFLENTNPNRQDLRRVEYGDERDPEMRAFMEKIAPANNASKITKPLYVVQGYNDPRVPVTEAEQMVREIRQAGGQVWYCCAADEGHGFAKKNNRDYYWQSAVLFLEKYLLNK